MEVEAPVVVLNLCVLIEVLILVAVRRRVKLDVSLDGEDPEDLHVNDDENEPMHEEFGLLLARDI